MICKGIKFDYSYFYIVRFNFEILQKIFSENFYFLKVVWINVFRFVYYKYKIYWFIICNDRYELIVKLNMMVIY